MINGKQLIAFVLLWVGIICLCFMYIVNVMAFLALPSVPLSKEAVVRLLFVFMPVLFSNSFTNRRN